MSYKKILETLIEAAHAQPVKMHAQINYDAAYDGFESYPMLVADANMTLQAQSDVGIFSVSFYLYDRTSGVGENTDAATPENVVNAMEGAYVCVLGVLNTWRDRLRTHQMVLNNNWSMTPHIIDTADKASGWRVTCGVGASMQADCLPCD